MQTFLPFACFILSAKSLDWKRLGKQRIECAQILKAIERLAAAGGGTSGKIGWANHPATVQWRDYVPALKLYYNVVLREWIARGYNNTMQEQEIGIPEDQIQMPPWMGDESYHACHRANLLRKDREFYQTAFSFDIERAKKESETFGWREGKAGYLWPAPASSTTSSSSSSSSAAAPRYELIWKPMGVQPPPHEHPSRWGSSASSSSSSSTPLKNIEIEDMEEEQVEPKKTTRSASKRSRSNTTANTSEEGTDPSSSAASLPASEASLAFDSSFPIQSQSFEEMVAADKQEEQEDTARSTRRSRRKR